MSPAQAQEESVFKSSITLETLAPLLFPSVEADLVLAPLHAAWISYQLNSSFHLAVLNFLYLLITADQLRDALDISDLWKDGDVAASYIQPLQQAEQRFIKAIKSQDAEIACDNEAEREQLLAELNILTDALAQVTSVVPKMNE